MIIIEDLISDHFELIAGWLSRPDTNRWLTSEWRNRKVSSSMIAIAVRNKKNRLFLVKSDEMPSGLVGLSDIDLDDKTSMIWYFLGNLELSCKGVISEAVRKLVSLAFHDMGLLSVYAWIMENNIASEKVLYKVGFSKAGCIRLATNSSGIQVNRIYFDLINKL